MASSNEKGNLDENGGTESVRDLAALNYFLSLKQNYSLQRLPWETKWTQALANYHLLDEAEQVYEGRAKIRIPIMKWKVNGIVARINKILFNVDPIARLEDSKVDEKNKNLVDLWNKYIFDYQLGEIGFKEAFKLFIQNKTIFGTSVAKISQEFEEKEFSFFDDEESETITVKDNTYFRNMLLTEFYSDVNKLDIQESQACIHTTNISMEELRRDEIGFVIEETETEFGFEENRVKTGFYKNLNLLVSDGTNITDEQAEYIQLLGLNETGITNFKKDMEESKKTGFIKIDECYGKFDLDGDGIAEEVVCTVANGRVVIRLEPTPFKHTKLVRPFIVGRYEPIANCLYGNSNVILGRNLLMELNAARAQATDARTRSVANMWYMDETKNVRWDMRWKPGGVVKGQGQNGLTPLINPNLSNVSINDSTMIQRDIDQLWSLSPVQEGTSDRSQIPSTARGTLAIISQNDMPLNDIIDNTTERELKPFIEMLYERNLVFKDVDDLLDVWDEKDIEQAGVTAETSMSELQTVFNIKVLGNLELSNEIAHQQGWQAFLSWAQTIPPIAKRLDWQAVAEKQLASFGIKDDSEGIWHNEEEILKTDQAQSEAQQQQLQAAEQQRQKVRGENISEAQFLKEIDTEADIVKMQSEAVIEKTTGQKIQ